MKSELYELDPAEALEMYAADRQSELSQNSIDAIWTRVGNFVEWCEDNEMESLADLRGIHIHRYKVGLQDSVAHSTISNRLYAVRRYLKWATTIDAVDPELPDKITVPDSDEARESALYPDEAEDLLAYLRKFQYASRPHVTLELLWHSGMRMGALRGIDLEDFHPNPDEAGGAFTKLCHRPETDTPLKNGQNGERPVGLSDYRGNHPDGLHRPRAAGSDRRVRTQAATHVLQRPGQQVVGQTKRVLTHPTPCVRRLSRGP